MQILKKGNDGRVRYRPFIWFVRDFRCRSMLRQPCDLPHGSSLHNIADAKLHPPVSQHTDQTDGLDGISAKRKEAVQNAYGLCDAKKLLHGAGNCPFRFVPGLFIDTRSGNDRLRKRLPVDLPARAQRHLRKLHKERRQHILCQPLREICPQITSVDLMLDGVIEYKLILKYADRRRLYPLIERCLIFNFPGLYSKASELQLGIHSSQILQVAVLIVSGKIAGPVDPAPLKQAAADKFFFRQALLLPVPFRDLRSGKAQLTPDTRRKEMAETVADIACRTRNRPSDGDTLFVPSDDIVRGTDCKFRRAVSVDHLKAGGSRRLQSFSAHHQVIQRKIRILPDQLHAETGRHG